MIIREKRARDRRAADAEGRLEHQEPMLQLPFSLR